MNDNLDRASIILHSPAAGLVGPLSNLPDEAFASGTLGPGFQLEPLESRIYAPCDGIVVSVARTKHAVTLKTENQAELLIHVGLETVRLGGVGFEVHVTEGQKIKAGQLLIEFDADILMRRAKSLATPIVLLTHETHSLEYEDCPEFNERGTRLGQIELIARANTDAPTSRAIEISYERKETVLLLADGLHARPAAQISKLAKRHQGQVKLRTGEREANAKSIAGVMGLGASHGDTVAILAEGSGAAQITKALLDLIESGAGDPVVPIQQAVTSELAPTPIHHRFQPGETLTGVTASLGLAVGPVHQHQKTKIVPPDYDQDEPGSAQMFKQAREDVLAELHREAKSSPTGVAEILDAHAELIEDPDFIDCANDFIELGRSAGASVDLALEKQIELFSASGDARLNERISDLRDIGQRLLQAMYGTEEASQKIDQGAIIVADDLLPSEFLEYVERGIVGLCLSAGGQTSHVSILATGQSIPTLVAAGPKAEQIPTGTMAVLNASQSFILLSPGDDEIRSTQEKIELRKQAAAAARQAQHDRAITIDGEPVTVLSNLGSLDEASKAILNGAEGSGLLRTEFLFTSRLSPPDENEQLESYLAILSCMKNKPLTIRTLDIGGDKPVAFLRHGEEQNPALGMRGIRTLFAHPELMRDQVRAILRASQKGTVEIMVPMVSSISELERIRDYIAQQAGDLGIRQIPPIGTMIETPASAIIADQLCAAADFLSIGSNDLTQYTLAMDRGNPGLASQLDGLHPALLRLMQNVAVAAVKHDKPVSVCGGLASDPFAVPILLGMGIRKLSCAQSMIAPIKALIRDLDSNQCRAIAEQALNEKSGTDVRARVASTWPTLQRWT